MRGTINRKIVQENKVSSAGLYLFPSRDTSCLTTAISEHEIHPPKKDPYGLISQ